MVKDERDPRRWVKVVVMPSSASAPAVRVLSVGLGFPYPHSDACFIHSVQIRRRYTVIAIETFVSREHENRLEISYHILREKRA